jgi:hypothetical protein
MTPWLRRNIVSVSKFPVNEPPSWTLADEAGEAFAGHPLERQPACRNEVASAIGSQYATSPERHNSAAALHIPLTRPFQVCCYPQGCASHMDSARTNVIVGLQEGISRANAARCHQVISAQFVHYCKDLVYNSRIQLSCISSRMTTAVTQKTDIQSLLRGTSPNFALNGDLTLNELVSKYLSCSATSAG